MRKLDVIKQLDLEIWRKEAQAKLSQDLANEYLETALALRVALAAYIDRG